MEGKHLVLMQESAAVSDSRASSLTGFVFAVDFVQERRLHLCFAVCSTYSAALQLSSCTKLEHLQALRQSVLVGNFDWSRNHL